MSSESCPCWGGGGDKSDSTSLSRRDKLNPMGDHVQKQLILAQDLGSGVPESPSGTGWSEGRSNLHVEDASEPLGVGLGV